MTTDPISLRSRVRRTLKKSDRIRQAHSVYQALTVAMERSGNRRWGLVLDYPVESRPRYGHGRPPHPELLALIEGNRAEYSRLLSSFAAYMPSLQGIARREPPDSASPWWTNKWFPPLDAVSLYSLLRSTNPRQYVEIGSGHSTRFARRAILDGGLGTQLTSIDPHPRVEIDSLCDRLIRSPLEDLDLSLFGELGEGDILFIDGSHRVLMNSDTAVLWLEILPRLVPGVLLHIHDVFLPFDYPPAWATRYYSEHYLLAVALLWGSHRMRVVFPSAFVLNDPILRSELELSMQSLELERSDWMGEDWSGTSMWLAIG